MIAALS